MLCESWKERKQVPCKKNKMQWRKAKVFWNCSSGITSRSCVYMLQEQYSLAEPLWFCFFAHVVNVCQCMGFRIQWETSPATSKLDVAVQSRQALICSWFSRHPAAAFTRIYVATVIVKPFQTASNSTLRNIKKLFATFVSPFWIQGTNLFGLWGEWLSAAGYADLRSLTLLPFSSFSTLPLYILLPLSSESGLAATMVFEIIAFFNFVYVCQCVMWT